MSSSRGPAATASPSRAATPLLVLLLSLLPLVAADPAHGVSPYRRGQTIEITGTVTDDRGAAAAGVRVVLLAAHRGFELRTFRRVEKGLVRVPAITDRAGRFTIDWRWDRYYDTFRLRVEDASTIRASGGAARVLSEIDIGRRLLEGSPVVVALEVGGPPSQRVERSPSAPPARAPQPAPTSSSPTAPTRSDSTRSASSDAASTARPSADAAGVSPSRAPASAPPPAAAAADASYTVDQQRIFDEMGKPDRVDRLALAGGEEVAWWYFERGRSYHFRDGRLEQVMQFDPVDQP